MYIMGGLNPLYPPLKSEFLKKKKRVGDTICRLQTPYNFKLSLLCESESGYFLQYKIYKRDTCNELKIKNKDTMDVEEYKNENLINQ